MLKRGLSIKSKRGISPLIATVLLVAFAVSIGTMIMSWGRDVVASPGDCPDVKLEIQTVSGKEMFCYDTLDGNVIAMIKNTGTVDILSMKLRVITPDLVVDEKEIPSSGLKAGSVKPHTIAYSRSGKFQVEIIPSIKMGGKEKICSEQALVNEDIPICG